MRIGRVSLAAACTLAVTLSACSSSGGGSTPQQSTGPAADLSSSLRSGVHGISSAHFVVDASFGGQPLTASGDETLAGGKLTALQASAHLPGGLGAAKIVVADGVTYAELPASLRSGNKPWQKLSADSSNPVVAQLAGFVDAALAAAGLGTLPDVVTAGSSVTKEGTTKIAGTTTTHYTLTIAPARLPSSLTKTADLGSKPIPADIYLDKSDRPIRVHVSLTIGGQGTDTTVTFSKFGQPVTIQPPPAGQVSG